ncbi:hypothetical protein XA3_02990 [Xylocopilactobacillus apicola]|uniref:Uncharacterized protein n=1 Tax=Xylocopilactobacillus apicola TaxID=2932184 RepID=A0AAU9DVE5_9LACO|nr:hypothetical protein XA3_02990 [Xylocopilactobacillus apicola]
MSYCERYQIWKKTYKLKVFDQLFTVIDQIYFRSTFPMMFNYKNGKLDNTYSNGVSGILDIIDLALLYYWQDIKIIDK